MIGRNDISLGMQSRSLASIALFAAVGMLFFYLTFEFNRTFGAIYPTAKLPAMTMLWMGFCTVFALQFRRNNNPLYLAVTLLLLVGAFAKLLLFDLPAWNMTARFWYEGAWSPFDAGFRLLDFGVMIAFLTFAYRLLCSEVKEGEPSVRSVGQLMGLSAIGMLFLYLTLEVNSFLNHFIPGLRSGGVSILWSVFALSLAAPARNSEGLSIDPLCWTGFVCHRRMEGLLYRSGTTRSALSHRGLYCPRSARNRRIVPLSAFQNPLHDCHEFTEGRVSMKRIHLHMCCRRAFYIWLLVAFLPVTLMAADETVKSPDSSSGPPAGNISNGTPFRFERPLSCHLRKPTASRVCTLIPISMRILETGFPDVRIVDQAGQSIPFVVRRSSDSQTTTRYMEWRPVRISLRPLAKTVCRFSFRSKKNDPQPAGFRIVTPLTNFENRVRVFDADTESGIPVVDDAIIYDYSQYMDVRRVDIPLPVTTARTFRIVIDDVTAEQESQLLELTRTIQGGRENGTTERLTIDRRPFRIDQIRFWADKAEERVAVPKLRTSAVSDFVVSEDAGEHRTVASFSNHGQPVSSVTIQTQDRNFSRLANRQVSISGFSGVAAGRLGTSGKAGGRSPA